MSILYYRDSIISKNHACFILNSSRRISLFRCIIYTIIVIHGIMNIVIIQNTLLYILFVSISISMIIQEKSDITSPTLRKNCERSQC